MARLRGRELLAALMTVMGFMKSLLEALMDCSVVDPVMHLRMLSQRPEVLRKLAKVADENLFELTCTTVPGIYKLSTGQDVLISEAVEWIRARGYRLAAFDQVVELSCKRPGRTYLFINEVANQYGWVKDGVGGIFSDIKPDRGRLDHESIPVLVPNV